MTLKEWVALAGFSIDCEDLGRWAIGGGGRCLRVVVLVWLFPIL